MKSKNSSRLFVCASLAAVWFGTNMGGGVAMGQNSLQFFSRFGWTSLIFPTLSITLVGTTFYYAWNFARLTKTYNYKEYVNKFYHPYEKTFGTILDVSFLIILCIPVGTSIAGGGELIKSLYGLSFMSGCLITGLIFFVMASFGVGFINKMSFWLTLVILLSLGAIAVLGIADRFDTIANVISTRKTGAGTTFWGALWFAILYSSFQSTNAPMIAASVNIKTKKEVLITTIIGIIANIVMITLLSVLLLGWFPGIINERLPNVKIAEDLGRAWLYYAYCVALYAAYVTTGVTFLFAVGKRYENSFLFKKVKETSIFVRKPETKATVVIFAATVYSLLASSFGVVALVKQGYTYVAYLYIPLVLIPQLVVGPIKCRRLEKEANKK